MSSHGFRTPLCNRHSETQPGGLFFQTGEILANLDLVNSGKKPGQILMNPVKN